MKLTKLSLAMASIMGAGLASEAMALDLYVDTKTQQIYAEPGKGRVKLGSFEKVEDTAAQKAEAAAQKAEIEQIKEDLALKNNELKALDEHMKVAEEVQVKLDKKGLQFESKDKDFKFKLGGRIHADAAYHSGDDLVKAGTTRHNEANDGTEIRRARMEFQGTFFKDWNFRTVADFADNAVAMKDVYLQYAGFKDVTLTAGQHKQLFSRELLESSNDLMFMERSLMDVLNAPVVDRAIGLSANTKGHNWTAGLGIYGDSITPPTKTATGAADKYDEGWGMSGRVTFAPIQEKTKLVHLGVAGNYRTADDNAEVSKSKALDYAYKSSHGSLLTLLEYKPTNVDSIKMLGLEASGLYGPFYAGGEYTRAWVDRDGGEDFTSDGWYTEAAWSITGESRKYKDGVFKYLEPTKPFNPKSGGWGAWELAARYSQVNLGKGHSPADDISASNLTVALNWYVNSNIRFMADYSRSFDFKNANVTYPDGAQPENMDVYMLRGQLAF